MKRWPLVFIAAPAAVAVWSGWVGLGGMCGFGIVHPLPGIVDRFQINSAITLPIGVEAYGTYALAAWLTPGAPERARTFARRSAIGALALGMTGQVIYHLLSAAHAARAPWPIVVLVSCLPVITLGFGAALAHLLRVPDGEGNTLGGVPGTAPQVFPDAFPGAPGVTPETTFPAFPETVPEVTPDRVPGPFSHPALEAAPGASGARSPRRSQDRPRAAAGNGKQPGPVTLERLREHYAHDLATGRVPSIRAIKRDWPVGYTTASELHDQLTVATTTSGT